MFDTLDEFLIDNLVWHPCHEQVGLCVEFDAVVENNLIGRNLSTYAHHQFSEFIKPIVAFVLQTIPSQPCNFEGSS